MASRVPVCLRGPGWELYAYDLCVYFGGGKLGASAPQEDMTPGL